MSGRLRRMGSLLIVAMMLLGSVALASPEKTFLDGDVVQVLQPAAAVAPDGSLWAAWVADLGDDWEILASRWKDGEWEPAQIVYANPDRWDDAPTLAFDVHGVAWLAWASSDGTDGTLHLSHWTGSKWSAPQEVPAANTSPNRQPVLAPTPDGGLWLAWVGFDGNDDEIYAALWDGSAWAEPQRVSSDDADPAAYDSLPSLVVAAEDSPSRGEAWLAWTSHDEYVDSEIYASRWDGRQWTAEEQVSYDDDSADSSPSLAIAEDGTVWLAWQGRTSEVEELRRRIFVSRWTETAGWDSERMISSAPESAVLEEQPVVAIGEDGRPQVVWQLDDGSLGLGHAVFDGTDWSSPRWAVKEAIIEGGLFAADGPPILAWWTENPAEPLPVGALELDSSVNAPGLPIFEAPGSQIQSTGTVDNRHLAFGDSITLGAYPDPATGVSVGPYPERLDTMLDSRVVASEVINDGVSGERTTWGMNRLLSVSWPTYQPQFLELMEGTNDVTGDKPPADTVERLEEMVKWPQKAGTRVLVATLLPRTDHRNTATNNLNDLIREMADRRNATLVDVWNAYYATGAWAQYLADTVHPDTEGMILLTETFYTALLDSVWWLEEDLIPPQTWMEPLPAQSPCGDVTVRWGGSDNLSYVVDYDVQKKENNGTWTDWIMATTETSANYSSQTFGSQVSFRVRGRDALGNESAYSASVSTQISDDGPPEVHVTALPAAQTAPFQVSWSGTDACGQVKAFDVEYRVGPAGEWKEWLKSTSKTSEAFTPASPQYGQTYYFHVGAYDEANNWSGWSTTASTILARYKLEGEAYNTRHQRTLSAEVIVPGALAIEYDSSRYAAYVLEAGDYSLDVNHDSYGDLPPMQGISVTADVVGLDFFLPPLDEVVSDGGFESGDLNAWQISGSHTPTLGTGAHTGDGAVILGGAGGTSQISQDLSIPAGLSNATLSFLVRLDDAVDGNSTIQVDLEGTSISSTRAISTEDWTHVWLPVDDARGEDVTLTFKLSDTAAVRLDEVSLGSAVQSGHWIYIPMVIRAAAP